MKCLSIILAACFAFGIGSARAETPEVCSGLSKQVDGLQSDLDQIQKRVALISTVEIIMRNPSGQAPIQLPDIAFKAEALLKSIQAYQAALVPLANALRACSVR